MLPKKERLAAMTAGSLLLVGGVGVQSQALAATATYDGPTATLNIPLVDVLNGAESSSYSAQLKLVSATQPFVLELVSAAQETPQTGQRVTFDSATSSVHLPSVIVGSSEFYAKLKLIPDSNPLRFEVDQLVDNSNIDCPSFASTGPVSGTCVLSGEINQDINLTSAITWILSGGVFVGGDNTNSATLTINPGTKIIGQEGADFLWVRRGSKIMAEGTPDNPIIFTGPLEQAAGEWGGLILAGNAPVNGCSEGVELCEVAFEAIITEQYGGNNPEDSSGLMKYTQIRYAGFEVRPDEELNGLTLNGVGSGTHIDFVQVHAGLDDGVEMFGGTVEMKHLVLTDIGDDSLDWGQGWRGKAQFVYVKQAADDGDRGIEADNNGDNNDAEPRSKPMLSNMTLLGSPVSSQGALLRRGTSANIFNSVFSGFGEACLRIDGGPTYTNAGTPESLSGELTIENSYVDCATNFSEGSDASFLVSDWFNAQTGNVAGDPQLEGHLPAAGSPLTTGGASVDNSFFDSVDYVGAFKDASDDWTAEWTL